MARAVIFLSTPEQIDVWLRALRGRKSIVVTPDEATAWAVGERLADFGVGMAVEARGSARVWERLLGDDALEVLVMPKETASDWMAPNVEQLSEFERGEEEATPCADVGIM
ncbi:MAG: hypothetical protein K6T30_08800 [Alicyclobacillus sp.]|nr:hypothetical protein [Alicyclobacillus sp.]